MVANLHEMHSFLSKEIRNKNSKKTLKDNYCKILITMLPLIPHFTLECMEINGFNIEQDWPSYDENLIIENEIKYVIQINGKKRALIDAKRDITENNLLKEIKSNNNLSKYLENKKLIKIIFIKNRHMNIIL